MELHLNFRRMQGYVPEKNEPQNIILCATI